MTTTYVDIPLTSAYTLVAPESYALYSDNGATTVITVLTDIVAAENAVTDALLNSTDNFYIVTGDMFWATGAGVIISMAQLVEVADPPPPPPPDGGDPPPPPPPPPDGGDPPPPPPPGPMDDIGQRPPPPLLDRVQCLARAEGSLTSISFGEVVGGYVPFNYAAWGGEPSRLIPYLFTTSSGAWETGYVTNPVDNGEGLTATRFVDMYFDGTYYYGGGIEACLDVDGVFSVVSRANSAMSAGAAPIVGNRRATAIGDEAKALHMGSAAIGAGVTALRSGCFSTGNGPYGYNGGTLQHAVDHRFTMRLDGQPNELTAFENDGVTSIFHGLTGSGFVQVEARLFVNMFSVWDGIELRTTSEMRIVDVQFTAFVDALNQSAEIVIPLTTTTQFMGGNSLGFVCDVSGYGVISIALPDCISDQRSIAQVRLSTLMT